MNKINALLNKIEERNKQVQRINKVLESMTHKEGCHYHDLLTSRNLLSDELELHIKRLMEATREEVTPEPFTSQAEAQHVDGHTRILPNDDVPCADCGMLDCFCFDEVNEEIMPKCPTCSRVKHVCICDMLIEELNLNIRAYNCLWHAGKRTFREVVSMDVEDMLKVRNLGKRSLLNVIRAVREYQPDFLPEVNIQTGLINA